MLARHICQTLEVILEVTLPSNAASGIDAAEDVEICFKIAERFQSDFGLHTRRNLEI